MGGMGSGGRNKTHKQEEDFKYRKIDSFAFYDFLNSDKYLCYKNEVKYPVVGDGIIYHVQTRTASIKSGCCRYPLELSRVTNIDGKVLGYTFYVLSAVNVSDISIKRMEVLFAGRVQS